MSDCCLPSPHDAALPNKLRCPRNGQVGAAVSLTTIRHHIQAPWNWVPASERYYFCEDARCGVAYFGSDGSVIEKAQLRTPNGAQTDQGDDLLCYCFGVSRAEYGRNPATRDFIVAQTKAGACACESRNPSGRCCLKDFPTPA